MDTEAERRHRNHLAGQRFRAKKKAEAEMLEDLCKTKTKECNALRKELEALQIEVCIFLLAFSLRSSH